MKKNALLLMLAIGVLACSTDEYDNNLQLQSVQLDKTKDNSDPDWDWDKTRYNNSHK